jgi:surface protein
MSFGYATKRNITPKQVSTSNIDTRIDNITPWVRNPSWTALPAMTGADNKFVGLHRVDVGNANFLALSAAGNYTVDWGDGSATENINNGVVAQHQYVFTDAGLANTNAPVTLTDTGDVVTRTAHGYLNGYTVRFYNIVSTTGLSEGQIYYVISATENTFQVSATLGGSALPLTTDGTATLLPYKLAVVTVTPQAGQTFTTINVHRKHNQTNLNSYVSGFLDIKIAGSSLTSILIGVATAATSTRLIDFRSLERVCILSNAMTNASASYLFSTMTALQNVVLVFDSALTDISFMFTGCTSLTTVPLFNTASVTNMTSMFNTCTSLTTAPLFNTASVTSMNSMFTFCGSLTIVPLFNTVNVTDMASMFNACRKLIRVPLFNTASVTTMQSMFSSCQSLITVPLFNTTGTNLNMNNMFNTCTSLTTVPLFNTASVTNMNAMFGSCSALQSLPLFNTANVTNMGSMFSGCSSLTTVPLFNTANVTNMSNMFQFCTHLKTVPLFVTTGASLSMASMFLSCTSLTTVPLFNTASVVSMGSMFSNCTSLTTVPLFNTANVTNMGSMFSSCASLVTVPLFNTASVTTVGSMFGFCASLTTVPVFNLTNATTVSMFGSCPSLVKATVSGVRFAQTVNGSKLSETELTSIIDNIGRANSQGLVLNISSNWGAVTPVSLTCTPTAGLTTITAANTAGVVVGMQWTGTGSPATTAIACTFTDAGDLVTKNAHGLSNGDRVSFATIVTTTGILTNTIYFVINAAADTFQVAATSGGAAIALTTNGTGTVRWESVVTAITPNTNITVSRPATATGSTSLAFRTLKTQTALLKGWAVTG